MIDRDFEQVSEEHMKSMTKPEGPAQEPHCTCAIERDIYGDIYEPCAFCQANYVPATPAPSQPASLLDAVEQLRAIPAAWKERPDPLAELHEIRHGSQPVGAREQEQKVACPKCGNGNLDIRTADFINSDEFDEHVASGTEAHCYSSSCGYDGPVAEFMPTPPVNQPTVTLDRETFDKAIARLERLRQILSPHAGYDGGRCAECVAVLYLLRAAEQK